MTATHIELLLPDGRCKRVQLPNNIKMANLLPALADKLGLPSVDEHGRAWHYTLSNSDGTVIPAEVTLLSAAIASDTSLKLQAIVEEWATPGAAFTDAIATSPLRIDSSHFENEPEMRSRRVAPARRANNQMQAGVMAGVVIILFVLVPLLLQRASDQPRPVAPPTLAPLASSTENFSESQSAELNGRVYFYPIEITPASAPNILSGAKPLLESLTIVDEQLFFFKKDEVGYGLWHVDGQSEAEQLQFVGSRMTSQTREIVAQAGRVYFWVEGALWQFELEGGEVGPAGFQYPPAAHIPIATAAGFFYVMSGEGETRPLRFATNSVGLAVELPVAVRASWTKQQLVIDGILYFVGYDPDNGFELWRSDGSSLGTYLLADLDVGPDSSDPNQLVEHNGVIYFAANVSAAGPEIFYYSAELEQIGSLIDLASQGESNPRHLNISAGKLFYSAQGINGLRQFRVYDLAEGESKILGSQAYHILTVSNQLALTEEGAVFIANGEDIGSQVGVYTAATGTLEWRATAGEKIKWAEVYASSTQILLIDDFGLPYQLLYDELEAKPIAGIGQLLDVIVLPNGDFLLADGEGVLWQVNATETIGSEYLTTPLAQD